MKGKVIVSALLATAVIAGAGLWYSIERAYYTEITGVNEVMAYGDAFPVSNYRGIDADTSPLKMRACFDVDWDYFPTDEFKEAATPLRAPRFFDCFDAGQITQDLEQDKASAILSDENKPFGFDTFIVQYPDGKAYMWRQINECGEAKFGGDDLPEGCIENEEISSAPQVSEPEPVKPKVKEVMVVEPPSLNYAPATLAISLLPFGATHVETIAASDASAVQDETAPLSLHGCFKTNLSLALMTETYQTHETPMPDAKHLECFDAEQLQADLQSGNALAFVGETITTGVERVIAVYEDGRGYAWHQKAKSD